MSAIFPNFIHALDAVQRPASMPEFILRTPRNAHPFYSLDTFAKGYVEAMLFTNGDTGDDDEWSLNGLGVERLTRSAVKSIKAECDAFLGKVSSDGRFMRQVIDSAEDYDDEQAGRDFWFTRQGHGVGFWDREALDVPGLESDTLGDMLDAAAKSFGEADVELYRGWIYHR